MDTNTAQVKEANQRTIRLEQAVQSGKQQQEEELEKLMNKQDKSFARAINQTKEELNAQADSQKEELEKTFNAKLQSVIEV